MKTKKIPRVYFSNIQISDRFPLHSVYKELIKNPPLKYCNDDDGYKKHRASVLPIEKIAGIMKMPSIWYTKIRCDMIHAGEHLVINKIPWVIDLEHIGALVGFNYERLEYSHTRFIIRKYLEKDNCRTIMPWTESAKKSIINTFPGSRLAEKINVVYPAITAHDNINKRKKDTVNILAVGKGFQKKGGEEAIHTCRRLCDKHENVRCTLIMDIPEAYQEKFKHKNIRVIRPNIKREEMLNKYFSEADIFFLPTRCDTFGMVFLEAMRYKLPIVTTEGFGREEIVEHGKTGFLVKGYPLRWYNKDYTHNKKYVDIEVLGMALTKELKRSMVDRCEKALKTLIEDDNLRKKMGSEAFKAVSEGKFSIKERNRQLISIYEEAVD